MDPVSDSDGENSLPLLSVDAIDTSSLRRGFGFLSSETKQRLRGEAGGTPFEEVYDSLCQYPPSSPERIVVQSSSPQKEQEQEHSIMELPALPTVHEQHQESSAGILNSPGAYGGQRSLRKRTFASRHPYIADQADYLGICTIDSINEMFSDHDDLVSVARVLNQLYLKRKKRYPDEERYKARNFYAHLGKSKAMALAGDPDAETMDIQDDPSSSQLNYVPENNSDDEEQDLIPYEGSEQHRAPPKVYDSASNTEEEYESGDEDYSIQETFKRPLEDATSNLKVYRSRKKAKRQEQPRKGLAVRKMGSSASKRNLAQEFEQFVDLGETAEEYTPNYPSYFQPQITSFQSDLSEMIRSESSSDYNSDSDTDLFSDSGIADTTKSSDVIEPPQTYLDDYALDGAAEEADHINHLFASGKRAKSRKTKPTQSRHNIQAPRQRKATNAGSSSHPRQRKSASTGITRPRTARPRGSSYGRLNTRKLSKPLTQTNRTNSSRPSKQYSKQGESATRKNQKQSVLSVDVDSESDKENNKENGKTKPKQKQSTFRNKNFLATTTFQVESSTRFVKEHPAGFAISPAFFNPSKASLFSDNLSASSTSILAYSEVKRIHSIGDGFIFFPHQDTVSFMLLGKSYVFGLFQQESSSSNLLRLLSHLRKLMSSVRVQLERSIRDEIKEAIRGLIKWLLILRQPIPKQSWHMLNSILDDFTKLQTKEVRKHQTYFYAQMLLTYYVGYKLEASIPNTSHGHLYSELEKFSTDFWSILFRTYDSTDLAATFTSESPNELSECLSTMYFIFSNHKDIWWPTVVEALQDLNPIMDSSFETMNTTYALASMCPMNRYNWAPFITILNSFQSSSSAEDHHNFIDVCELAHKNLNWPLDEKLVLTLYSSFAKRKFTNFDNETSVPTSIGVTMSRHDIPDDTVFERFLGFVHSYISELTERKEVKRLVTKLVASSQYHYQKGRKYQIMFINRLNLILLLFQISDVELRSPFSSLIDQIIKFKDMFIYSRAVDAFNTFVEVSERKNLEIPIAAFQAMLHSFCASYDRLQGMPSLLAKLIDCGLRVIDISKTPQSLRFFKAIDLAAIPDRLRGRVLDSFLSFAELLRVHKEYALASSDLIDSLTKSVVSFLSTQMNRLPVLDARQDALLENLIEKAIQIWIQFANANGSQNWNFMMLQKFSYLGNKASRDRFALYFCWVYLNQGEVSHSAIFEMDKLLCRALISSNLSKYSSLLFQSLNKVRGSLMSCRKIPAQSSVSAQAHKFQILTSVIQKVSVTSSMVPSEKTLMIADMVKELEIEFNTNYDNPHITEFLRRMINVMTTSCLSLLEDVEEFWSISEKLGFPSKRMQSLWAEATNEERISLLNIEFVNALKFEKDYAETFNKWINPKNAHILFALLEIYMVAASRHDLYWAHVSFIIRYIEFRLTQCTIDVVDRQYAKLLNVIRCIPAATFVSENSTYVMYQIEALSKATEIMIAAGYIYDGYSELDDHLFFRVDMIHHEMAEPKAEQASEVFTDIQLNQLKGSDAGPYLPPFEHSDEEYSQAIEALSVVLNEARLLVPKKMGTDPDDPPLVPGTNPGDQLFHVFNTATEDVDLTF
ncbi:hypothetical protein FT662_02325 [Candidozyma haemuli var. vulneris]|nr:hypothetical protein FT662_02325 [[Candida] haemuloni var. vulneris]